MLSLFAQLNVLQTRMLFFPWKTEGEFYNDHIFQAPKIIRTNKLLAPNHIWKNVFEIVLL